MPRLSTDGSTMRNEPGFAAAAVAADGTAALAGRAAGVLGAALAAVGVAVGLVPSFTAFAFALLAELGAAAAGSGSPVGTG